MTLILPELFQDVQLGPSTQTLPSQVALGASSSFRNSLGHVWFQSRYESVFIASLQVLDLFRRWQRNLSRSHLAEDGVTVYFCYSGFAYNTFGDKDARNAYLISVFLVIAVYQC